MSRRLLRAVLLPCLAPVVVAAAAPPPSALDRLDAAVEAYRRIAAHGGWSRLPDGPALRPGDRHATVPAFRARLAASGDLAAAAVAAAAGDPSRYDAALAGALRAFQRRHGLGADGVVGPATRAALDVPADERLAQLELARWRAAQPTPTGRWIRVNVPRFSLEVLDGDAVRLEMPVVVGRPSRPTPVMERTLSSLVVNPAWSIPPDLAYLDLLPKIAADPGYLASRNIDVYESWEPGARRLDARRIDWRTIGRGVERLMLRQRPGPGNALGHFLFRMDGEHDVFLHDTPSRQLFQAPRRDFSSGCIRVADARTLARALVAGDPAWSPRGLEQAVSQGETVTVTLQHPVPIRIVYETAWVDAGGAVAFRDDLYGEDARQLARLRRAGTVAAAAAPDATLAPAPWGSPLAGAARTAASPTPR